MAYNTVTFVAFEQPTAAKMNLLGENDAGFRDGTNISNDVILARHIDWASTGANGGIWGEELQRVLGSGSSTTLTLPTFSARKHLTIIAMLSATSIDALVQFNNDTGNNYAIRYMLNWASVTAAAPNSGVYATIGTVGAINVTAILNIENISATEKMVHGHCVGSGSGASLAPYRFDYAGKWTNTASQITRVDFKNTGGSASGNISANSLAIALGHD